MWSRVGASDGGGQNHVARDGEHSGLRGLPVNDKVVVCPSTIGSVLLRRKAAIATGYMTRKVRKCSRALTTAGSIEALADAPHSRSIAQIGRHGAFPLLAIVVGLVSVVRPRLEYLLDLGVVGRTTL